MLTVVSGAPAPQIFPPFSGRDAAALAASARDAIDRDITTAKAYLEQLEHLLSTAREAVPDDRPAKADVARGGLAAWQVRLVRNHVDAHLERPIAIGELARLVKLSSGHFSLAFRTSLGETPHAYVMRRRVEQAQHLMVSTRESLSQIADACGLADQAHLTRLFRKFVDDTPLSWRRKWQRAA